MGMDHHDTAQVCLNGHLANSSSKRYPQFNEKHCQKCGAVTITQCRECGHEIRGDYHGAGIVSAGMEHPPAFCLNCGKAYPWTAASLQAARDLAQELDALSPEEQARMAESLPDLISDNPRTTVAATRFRRLMLKAGEEAVLGFKQILVNIVAEGAKKILWP
jgi:hypothetical protein